MGGEVMTKALVLMAGLIAVGATASSLVFDPAVREAERENLLETPARGPLVVDDAVVVRPADADGTLADAAVADAAVADEAPADDFPPDDLPTEENVLVVAPAADPTATVVPFFVTLPLLVVALAFTVWAMIRPAEALGRPALIAGAIVLVGTLAAWGLYEAGLSEIAMTGTALTAWITVGLSLLAAWLVADVLSTPSEDEAVPG